jgi:hypothetical protein
MSAIPKSWKPSRGDGSSSLYCLIGDFVSQEIAFVRLIKIFVAILHHGVSISSTVAHDEAGVLLLDSPRPREAATLHQAAEWCSPRNSWRTLPSLPMRFATALCDAGDRRAVVSSRGMSTRGSPWPAISRSKSRSTSCASSTHNIGSKLSPPNIVMRPLIVASAVAAQDPATVRWGIAAR